MVALTIQTVVMTAYLRAFEAGELSRVWRNRGKGMLVGIASMLGSVGWFTAMTLQNVAYVRTVGQVELIFTFLTAILVFRKRIRWTELLGTALIIAGILFLLLS